MDVIAWNVFILQIYKKRKSSVKITIKKNTRKATGLISIFLKEGGLLVPFFMMRLNIVQYDLIMSAMK